MSFNNISGKRKSFSIKDKMDILTEYDNHVGTQSELAQRLGLSVSTLNTIIKSRDEIEKCYAQCGPLSKKRKSLKKSPLEKLELSLAEWFKQARASNVSISGSILREKALHIANRLQIQNFHASNGWIDRFKKRFNVVYKVMAGESKSVDLETVKQWKEEKLLKEVEGYELCDIYNADETGLFYNMQPNKTLAMKNEVCHGGKKSKQRITVLLTCNADGSDKLPPLVIGKYQNPRCFKNIKKLPVTYTSNSKSWMTIKIFEEYLQKLDALMIKKRRKILLLIDQCPAHPRDTSYLKNVKVIFFPANCTSHLQPLDLGVIHSFKCHYRKQFIRKCVAMIDDKQLQDASQMNLNLLEAIHFIQESWRLITITTINNCFRICGFHQGVENICYNQTSTSDDRILSEDEERDWKLIQPSGITFEEYARCDDNLILFQLQSVDEIVDENVEVSVSAEEEEDENIHEVPQTTFFEALKGIESARNFFLANNINENTGIILKCNEIINELYKIRTTKKKQQTLKNWLKSNTVCTVKHS